MLMIPVRRKVGAAADFDAAGEIRRRFRPAVRAGAAVAVGVGSRGISGLAGMVRAVLDVLREAGARPFIVPAMGSHGGATPEGQRGLLAEYGVTEDAMGVPLRDAMDTVLLGSTPEGIPVHFAAEARRAAAVVVVNRVKPHTDFFGPLGSGLQKMLAVGFGKRKGAAAVHAAAARFGMERVIRAVSAVQLAHVPVLAGIALIEDERHRTARVEVLQGGELAAREGELLADAKRRMARLPFEGIDLLIVDRMGKNISGAGMDPNVIGRTIHGYSSSLAEHAGPPGIHRIYVRDLTPESHGNATGIGLADFASARLVRGIDWAATRMNAYTSLSLNAFKVPFTYETDRECIEHALRTVPLAEGAKPRVLRVRDTLDLDRMEASEGFAGDLEGRSDLEAAGPARELAYDAAGNLHPMEA
jgi:hypothetical protein